jgi:hypothetical protein
VRAIAAAGDVLWWQVAWPVGLRLQQQRSAMKKARRQMPTGFLVMRV